MGITNTRKQSLLDRLEMSDDTPQKLELSDSGQHRTSPAREDGDDEPEDQNDGGPTEIEQESIEQMDNIIDSFRSNEITKLKALSTIISILDLNPSRTEGAKDAAMEYYTKTLDEVQALSSSVIGRGHQQNLIFTCRQA